MPPVEVCNLSVTFLARSPLCPLLITPNREHGESRISMRLVDVTRQFRQGGLGEAKENTGGKSQRQKGR